MSGVNVLITAPLAPELLDQIRSVDDRVQLQTLTDVQRTILMGGETDGAGEDEERLRGLINGAEVMFCGYEARKSGDVLAHSPNLRWLHTVAAGIEDFLSRGFGRGSYQFTNGSGPHAIPMGEFVILEILMFAKQVPAILRNQRDKKWARVGGAEIYGSTVGIIGLGDIGAAVAERAHAMGCRILATRRSVEAPQRNAGPVDELLPPSETDYLLQQSDYVVLSAPLTPETHHMINARTLRLMKPTAYLINVARGGIIDEPALIEALQSGVIAGAALDVFDQEPLPPDSPFWEMENVIVTPHISPTSWSDVFMHRHVELFIENLRRYLDGKPLMNVVDVERGY